MRVIREPHLGTGISNIDIVDWGALSGTQAENEDPDAVVMFIGANEFYPMTTAAGATVQCCGDDWEAELQALDRADDGQLRRRGRRQPRVLAQPADAARPWTGCLSPRP